MACGFQGCLPGEFVALLETYSIRGGRKAVRRGVPAIENEVCLRKNGETRMTNGGIHVGR